MQVKDSENKIRFMRGGTMSVVWCYGVVGQRYKTSARVLDPTVPK